MNLRPGQPVCTLNTSFGFLIQSAFFPSFLLLSPSYKGRILLSFLDYFLVIISFNSTRKSEASNSFFCHSSFDSFPYLLCYQFITSKPSLLIQNFVDAPIKLSGAENIRYFYQYHCAIPQRSRKICTRKSKFTLLA